MFPSSPSTFRPLLALPLLAAALGCSGGATPAAAVATPPVIDRPGEARCGVLKSQDQPLIVEWPSTERGKLESQARKGLVAVSYVGCEMKVLGQCSAPGQYGYSPLTRKRDRVTMRDSDELYANIPVYAFKFEGELARAGELDVEMTIVGRMEAERSSFRLDELSPGCEGATHVVTAITVGAFQFFAGADATIGAGAEALGVEAGAKSQSRRELLTYDGDATLCDKASLADKAPPEGCGALLRVEVVPLGEAKQAEVVCPPETTWNGAQCVRGQVVTTIECPAGTSLQEGRCVAKVSTDCPGGTHFVSGKGCLAEVVAAQAPRPPASPPPRREGQESVKPPSLRASPETGRMVRLPGGTFTMGSDASNQADEKPAHTVRVGSFFMDVTEVTTAAYGACVSAGRCSAPDDGQYCNWKKAGREQHPINCVDWNQATAYCGYAGKRLPTEEEWEYAARGSAGREYPWGSASPSQQLCWGRAGTGKPNSTCEVGTSSAGNTPEGLMDLAGNVWEWTSSPYCPYNSNSCTEAARVFRGGGWDGTFPGLVRGALRGRNAPSFRFFLVGFRCARAD